MRKSISDELIFKDLETYKGKVLLLSRIILGSKNTKEGTLIEILQKPADMGQKLSKDKEKFMGLLFIGCFLKGKPYEAAMKRHMK